MVNPYYDRDGITIYHGDCREILPELPKVDLVLTDPPYGIANIWKGGTWGTAPKHRSTAKWDSNTVDIETITAIVACGAVAIIWGGNYYPLPVSRCWLSWEKTDRMATLADFELAWTNLDRPSKSWRSHRHYDRHDHPTQKPAALMKWCIERARQDGGSVFDPFMGSGTTLLAARDMGRNAIGIEIEEKYCELAAKRLAQDVLF